MQDTGVASLLSLVLLLSYIASSTAVLAPNTPSTSDGPIATRRTRIPDKEAVVGFENAATQQLSPPPWLHGSTEGAKEVGLAPRDHDAASVLPTTEPSNTMPTAAQEPMQKQLTRFIVTLSMESAATAMAPVYSETDTAAVASAGGEGRTVRNTAAARAHAQAVQHHIEATAASAGVASKISHKYSYALSGFAVVNPTAAELEHLASDPNVVSIIPDKILTVQTYTTPQFLGLIPVGGSPSTGVHRSRSVWDQLGGVLANTGAGEGVVIGVVDTGVWMPNHTCFSDTSYWSGSSGRRQFYRRLSDWKGVCMADEETGTPPCNNKIITCKYYTQGWGGVDRINVLFPYEHISCKDGNGHGSHTASTAAGNYGGTSKHAPSGAVLSGIAPRARLAIYKAFWGRYGQGLSVDVIQAVDDAIQDGVDIISFSASSATDTFRDIMSTAFMNAARAGIFVSVAAGNEGPGPTVNGIAPWVMSVAASTHDRSLEVTLTLGNSRIFTGAGAQMTAVGPLPIVYAGDVALNINSTADAALCGPDTLDPSKAQSTIVVCDRGTYVLAKKVQEVLRAGGKGMVLVNVNDGKTNLFWVDLGIPYAHLPVEARDAVIQYARFPATEIQYAQSSSEPATRSATLGAARTKLGNTAPAMADFSSRGPIPVSNAVLLKPDITAPGVEVHAAYTGDIKLFDSISGTSMATPHISGIAALIKDKYPQWSPMAIKSAIMTTAYQTTRTGDVGQPFGTALDYGAGHVDPAAALNPGLVFNSSYTDWQRFLCDTERMPDDGFCQRLCTQGQAPNGTAASFCDAANFNAPSISGKVAASINIQRVVTAVFAGTRSLQFTATASADPGSSFNVTVSPSTLHVKRGSSKPVSISIKVRSDTELHRYHFGQVVWRSSRGHSVRIPIAVNFTDFVAPEYVRPPSREPSFEYSYKIGADSATIVDIKSMGMKAAQVIPVVVNQTDTMDLSAPGVGKVTITVPEGNNFFAIGLYSDDYVVGTDLDLLVYRGTNLVGKSVSDSSTEMLEATQGLPAGDYTVFIYPYKVPGRTTTAYLHVWMLSLSQPADNGLMQVSPTSVPITPGNTRCCPVTLSFTGLDFSGWPMKRYLGVLDYSRQDGKAVSVPRTRVYLV